MSTVARINTSMGKLLVNLYEKQVPNTVANFVHLASKGFYDGLKFHRVIDGFMIQAGCPLGTGTGGPGWNVADEFVDGLTHDSKGVLSMANAGPNTNGSQFFITLDATPWLDGKHTVFGKVRDGLNVLEAIGAVRTDGRDRPLKPVVIESIEVLRDGQPVSGVQPKPEVL
jgi:cyclophilin family peptidyl-prolyl cis-trans isomerase